jgi:hypothetical protein
MECLAADSHCLCCLTGGVIRRSHTVLISDRFTAVKVFVTMRHADEAAVTEDARSDGGGGE